MDSASGPVRRCVLVVGSVNDRKLWKKLFADALPMADGSVLECVRLQVQVADEGVRFVELVVIRKLCRGLDVKDDHKNNLFAMMHANTPAVNSLESVYFCLDRIPCHAALSQIRDRIGAAEFPLIDQHYYPSHRTAKFTPDFPLVAKVGHAEAGYGKMLFRDAQGWDDFTGVLALHSDYFTAEPFHEKEYDLRIQKNGSHYRAFERRSSNWKTNVGTSVLEEVPIKPHWKRWADLASTACGGMQILTVDAMHLADGSEIITEINDTASGFSGQHREEDSRHVVELAVELANATLAKYLQYSQQQHGPPKSPRAAQLAALGKRGIPKH